MSDKLDREALRAILVGVNDPMYDEVFNKLSHGELTARQEWELRTHEDPKIRELYDLFKPYDKETRESFWIAIQEALEKKGQ